MTGEGSGTAALPGDLVDRVRARLAGLGVEPDPDEVVRAVRAESDVLHGHLDLLRTARLVREHLAGAGPLEALLASPGVTDVVVDGPGPALVDRGRGLEATDVVVPTEPELRALAVRLAGRAGQRLDDARPWADGVVRSRDGMAWRLHAVLPPVAVDGTCLSLRVSRPAQATFDRLVESGTVPPQAEPLLRALVAARIGYLVVGGTGSGKTTLLAALLGLVPPGERLLCVEDSPELRPAHPHVVRLVVRHGNVEGAGGVAMSDLVRQALRMRPDRIAVGEVRGGEVADLLAALNTSLSAHASESSKETAGESDNHMYYTPRPALMWQRGRGRECWLSNFRQTCQFAACNAFCGAMYERGGHVEVEFDKLAKAELPRHPEVKEEQTEQLGRVSQLA